MKKKSISTNGLEKLKIMLKIKVITERQWGEKKLAHQEVTESCFPMCYGAIFAQIFLLTDSMPLDKIDLM